MTDITIAELKNKLRSIGKLKFVPTHRIGDTGIGKTLEDLLEIKENNIPLCNIGKVAELKAYTYSIIYTYKAFILVCDVKHDIIIVLENHYFT